MFCKMSYAGLIAAAPGRRNSQLQNSSKAVEGMVRMKMEQKEYILLCLEDTNDWSNATTRRLIMQVSMHGPYALRALLNMYFPCCSTPSFSISACESLS